jgi:hypothetical protein
MFGVAVISLYVHFISEVSGLLVFFRLCIQHLSKIC